MSEKLWNISSGAQATIRAQEIGTRAASKRLRKPLTMEALLGNPDIIKPLANYIEQTNRFDRQVDGG